MVRKTLKGGQGCLPGTKGCAPGRPSVARTLGKFLTRIFTRRRPSPATKREVEATAAAAMAKEAALARARKERADAFLKAAARRGPPLWAPAEEAGTGLTNRAEAPPSLKTDTQEPPDLNDGVTGQMYGVGPRQALQSNTNQPKESPIDAAKWALKEAELADKKATDAEAEVEKMKNMKLTKSHEERIKDLAKYLRTEASRVAAWAERWVAFAARKEMEAQEVAAAVAAEKEALATEKSSGAADTLKEAAKELQTLVDFIGQNGRTMYAKINEEKRNDYIARQKEIKTEFNKALMAAPLTAYKNRVKYSALIFAAKP